MYADYTPREKLPVDGLGDWVQIGIVHWYQEQAHPRASLPEVQETTLDTIRSVVLEGLFELGTLPSDAEGFVPVGNLDQALEAVHKQYVDEFVWGWQFHWWLQITPYGAQLAEPLMEAYRRELDAEAKQT